MSQSLEISTQIQQKRISEAMKEWWSKRPRHRKPRPIKKPPPKPKPKKVTKKPKIKKKPRTVSEQQRDLGTA